MFIREWSSTSCRSIRSVLWLLTIAFARAQDQLAFDDFSDFPEALAFFNGVQPISYDVHLRLPLLEDASSAEAFQSSSSGGGSFQQSLLSPSESTSPDDQPSGSIKRRRQLPPPRYTSKGRVSLTFKWTASSNIFQTQRLLALHSKWIQIVDTPSNTSTTSSIRLWHLQHLTATPLRQLLQSKFTYNEDNEVVTFRLLDSQLQSGEMYRLEIDEFRGRIEEDGSKNGVFLTSPGLSTQFQLNDARRAFPCVDMPGKKAVFNFRIVHPASYVALSNTDEDLRASDGDIDSIDRDDHGDGWMRTAFLPTPIMATYALGFSLIPKHFVEKASLTTKASDGLRISIFYNPDRLTNVRQPSALLRYAAQTYEILRRYFEPRLPLSKLDVSIVRSLSILGMENWGLVNLREQFIIKENEVEQFGLLTHEFVHQWIGNLATTADWKHLCVQEGLTEHYARRAMADFYGGRESAQFQRYIFIRYLPAVQNETNNVGLKPIRQDFQGFDEAVAYCFGRVPFIWTMIERVVGGREPFDRMINRFLVDFSFKNFVLDDLLSYLTAGNASTVLQYYVDHGGYPSLFVHKLNESTYRLRQRQIVPLAAARPSDAPTFEIPSTKNVWPIPLSTSDGGQKLMITSDYDLPASQVAFDSRGVPMLNPDFAYFYRINYEISIWSDIARALLASSPDAYTEMTKAQFLNDFCFFRGLNLILGGVGQSDGKNETAAVEELTKQFLLVQSRLEIATNIFVRFYTKGC